MDSVGSDYQSDVHSIIFMCSYHQSYLILYHEIESQVTFIALSSCASIISLILYSTIESNLIMDYFYWLAFQLPSELIKTYRRSDAVQSDLF